MTDASLETPNIPIAAKIRPDSLDNIVGQGHIKDYLKNLISTNNFSLIFFGPPGCGKTSSAKAIANSTNSDFVELSAATATVKDIRAVVDQAKQDTSRRTILFLDEVHRFSKSQQDSLLLPLEYGDVCFIGATTENPYHSLNKAIISRCNAILPFQPLTKENLLSLLDNIWINPEFQDQSDPIKIDDKSKELLAIYANGDARVLINIAQQIVYMANLEGVSITPELVDKFCPGVLLRYDRDGDDHYDTISAFIKSMRGSDPDATLYYLARMLESNEDPMYIARRIVIHASEDVGLADPLVLTQAVAAMHAVEKIGLPEARINLAQAALAVALASKSNSSCHGIDAAIDLVRSIPAYPIPKHLRDSHYSGAKVLGHGDGYKYPHDYPYSVVSQQYLPDEIKDVQLYQPLLNEQLLIDRRKAINEFLKATGN